MVLTADVDLYTNLTFVNCHGVEAESSANYPILQLARGNQSREQSVHFHLCTKSLSHTHTGSAVMGRVPQTGNVKNAIGMRALPSPHSHTQMLSSHTFTQIWTWFVILT